MSVFKIPQDDKRLTMDNLQDLFMQYDNKQGPLEGVLGRAVSNFNRNQAPSATAETIPGAPKTEIPKSIYNSGFGLIPKPVGAGSWFNMSRENRESQAAMQESQMRELINRDEKGRVQLFMKAFPTEFSGHSPEEFSTVKEAQAALKLIQDNALKQADLDRKRKKDAADAEAKRRKLNPPSPFNIPGAAPQGASSAKTASDVLGKFGL